MKIPYIVRKEETGGYSAEIPSLPGCFTEGQTLRELRRNVREAVEGYFESLALLPPGEDPAAGGDRNGALRTLDLRFAAPRRPPRRRARALAAT